MEIKKLKQKLQEAVQNIEAQADVAAEQASKNTEKASTPKTEAQNKKK